MERFYFDKVWRRERRAFKQLLMDWWLNKLSSEERRKIVGTMIREGERCGLFHYEINQLLNHFFGISDFFPDQHHKFRKLMDYPLWVLRLACELHQSKTFKWLNSISYHIYKNYRYWIDSKDLYWLLNRLNTEEFLKIKEKHDKKVYEAQRVVSHLEMSFILDIESSCDIQGVYARYLNEFEQVELEHLLYFLVQSVYYPVLIDSAVIDKLSVLAGVEPPNLGMKVVEVIGSVQLDR